MLQSVPDAQVWTKDRYRHLGQHFALKGREIMNLTRTAAAIAATDAVSFSVELLDSLCPLHAIDGDIAEETEASAA